MIATDRFVFLHLHKSGGSYVIDCLQRFLTGVREIGYHLPASLIPPALAGKPVLGLVRNPWSYYVSWYSFQRQRPQPNQLFQVLSDGGTLDFRATVNNMLDLAEGGALLDTLVARLPANYGGRGLNLPGPVLATIRGSGRGFYGFLYEHMYGALQANLHIDRMEALPGSLLDLFAAVGQPVDEPLRAHLASAPPRNPSQHGQYTSYYDEALRERVARMDAAVIARHGYRYGD
ncbi:MAG: hypothetical protein FJ197_10615 [Gammaproteobacteria bacterium]|nr:hypothetical protein [Gammaproteobacteria bacterium]